MEPIPATRAAFERMRRFGDTVFEEDVLEMGRAARAIIPTCTGLSLGHVAEGLTFTLASSSDEVAALDAVQYLDEGPCVQSASTRAPIDVNAGDLFDEHRWAVYARATAAAGVASSLTLPIEFQGQVVGAINLYASAPNAFNGHHRELAQALGGSAEHASSNGDLTFSTRSVAARAPAVLEDQDTIDIAIGVISTTRSVDILTAEEKLQDAATRAGITEVQAARTIRQIFTDW